MKMIKNIVSISKLLVLYLILEIISHVHSDRYTGKPRTIMEKELLEAKTGKVHQYDAPVILSALKNLISEKDKERICTSLFGHLDYKWMSPYFNFENDTYVLPVTFESGEMEFIRNVELIRCHYMGRYFRESKVSGCVYSVAQQCDSPEDTMDAWRANITYKITLVREKCLNVLKKYRITSLPEAIHELEFSSQSPSSSSSTRSSVSTSPPTSPTTNDFRLMLNQDLGSGLSSTLELVSEPEDAPITVPASSLSPLTSVSRSKLASTTAPESQTVQIPPTVSASRLQLALTPAPELQTVQVPPSVSASQVELTPKTSLQFVPVHVPASPSPPTLPSPSPPPQLLLSQPPLPSPAPSPTLLPTLSLLPSPMTSSETSSLTLPTPSQLSQQSPLEEGSASASQLGSTSTPPLSYETQSKKKKAMSFKNFWPFFFKDQEGLD